MLWKKNSFPLSQLCKFFRFDCVLQPYMLISRKGLLFWCTFIIFSAYFLFTDFGLHSITGHFCLYCPHIITFAFTFKLLVVFIQMIAVMWTVRLSGLVDQYQCFGRICCLHLQDRWVRKVGAEICSTEHCYCQAMWHHIQEDQNSNICCHEVASAEF